MCIILKPLDLAEPEVCWFEEQQRNEPSVVFSRMKAELFSLLFPSVTSLCAIPKAKHQGISIFKISPTWKNKWRQVAEWGLQPTVWKGNRLLRENDCFVVFNLIAGGWGSFMTPMEKEDTQPWCDAEILNAVSEFYGVLANEW